MDRVCIDCNKKLTGSSVLYCNATCQAQMNYKQYIIRWKLGRETGLRGKNTFNLSAHIIRYIKDKYLHKCAKCGWNQINLYTNNSPLEIDHIDGDFRNNTEDNLILLCPNCHSLTKTYKNLNKGHGRLWRREKYGKIKNVPL